jgi:thiamine-monophosphate kinase
MFSIGPLSGLDYSRNPPDLRSGLYLKFLSMRKKPSRPGSENRILELFEQRYAAGSTLLKKGIGDDAAVIHPRHAKEYWLVTTDALLEGIDFRREWTTPRLLGRKSISANLSDLAAMGARPRFFTASLALPTDISEHWIVEFNRGMTEPDSCRGAQLIGGDLSRSDKGIIISITALGESLNRKILYRSGGRPGDMLYVTGTLGRSAAGLKLLESGGIYGGSRSGREALKAHRTPEPRCETGIWLAQSGLVHCMMDLSDGLSMDLPRMCRASGVGAEIRLADIPVFTESRKWNCDPAELALHGGEDYELLFAVPKARSRLLEESYPSGFPGITRIGELNRDVGKVWLAGPGGDCRRLREQGYDHFRSSIRR